MTSAAPIKRQSASSIPIPLFWVCFFFSHLLLLLLLMADTHKNCLFFFFLHFLDQKGNHVIYDINRALESGAEAALASGRRDIFGLSKVLGTCVDLSFRGDRLHV